MYDKSDRLTELIIKGTSLFKNSLAMIMSLYETDYAQWTQSQIEALKARDWEKIDFEHLIENLEMGDPKETVESNLIIFDCPSFKTGGSTRCP